MFLLNPTRLGLVVGQVGMPDLEWQSPSWLVGSSCGPWAFVVTGAGMVCLDSQGHWDSCGDAWRSCGHEVAVVTLRYLWSLGLLWSL